MQSVSFQQKPPCVNAFARAHCWNTSVSDFERAEAGGGCIAFCLISSSITLMDLPALANSEEFACLWIFHCITMLPINIWISTVLLPLEKDASEDICILSVALLLFSGRQIESQGLLEDRRHFHCGSYHASLLCTLITAQPAFLFKKQPEVSCSVFV